MIRPILLLQLRPEDITSDNEYHAILKYGGLQPGEIVRMRIEQTGIPADMDPRTYSAIIVGGSPFDISTPRAGKPDIQLRIEQDFRQLFDKVIPADIPFLGACSGNGLLGDYLGTRVSNRYSEPVGKATLEITPAGKSDLLLSGFPDRIDVLLGHKEACDELPGGATLLITGSDCPVQMFRVGNNVYATQFHPEGDPEGFTIRINTYRHHGYFAPDEAEELIQNVTGVKTPYAQEILRRFVHRYRQA